MEYTLRPYPKYGDNKIEKDIVFDSDKTSSTFGCSYYYTKNHKIQERNRFLYKLVNDLETDNIDCASRSVSSYSTLSYRSNFAEYYAPMPPLYQDVNEDEKEPGACPPKGYHFVKHNKPFEHRVDQVHRCGEMLKKINSKILPGERKTVKSWQQFKEQKL